MIVTVIIQLQAIFYYRTLYAILNQACQFLNIYFFGRCIIWPKKKECIPYQKCLHRFYIMQMNSRVYILTYPPGGHGHFLSVHIGVHRTPKEV